MKEQPAPGLAIYLLCQRIVCRRRVVDHDPLSGQMGGRDQVYIAATQALEATGRYQVDAFA